MSSWTPGKRLTRIRTQSGVADNSEGKTKGMRFCSPHRYSRNEKSVKNSPKKGLKNCNEMVPRLTKKVENTLSAGTGVQDGGQGKGWRKLEMSSVCYKYLIFIDLHEFIESTRSTRRLV